MRRKILLTLGGLFLVLLLAVGAVAANLFGGLSPLVAEDLPGLGYVVKDGYVGVGVIDVGDGRVALVDAGNDRTGAALSAALTAHGQSLASVDAVFITHGHPDHVAALTLLPNAKVYAMAAEAPYVAGERAYRGPLPRLFGAQDLGGRVTHPVNDGDAIVVGARTVEGFHIPGHTDGSAAWLVDGVLFVGDSAAIESAGTMRGAPWVVTDDTAVNAASLRSLAKRLADREVLRIVASHSGSGPGSALFTFR